ncbi:telomere-binding protein cav isoform X2 [Scaptodrosophila lebanonensis]|uniref:Telomere-binding protein cav isoform X2 n=1 Tax=Drosophila lebanonensis TaxID=7225 RepID=A0A6J2TMW8_DROLE|nr:telomere-binding protein cav isoform X2 [Scaptodrosophila lebanonensis]
MSCNLPKPLLEYQAEEEIEVKSLISDPNLEDWQRVLMFDLYKASQVTSEDLSRKYTDDEVKELCLRTKCRVRMNMYNCVWDAKKRLTKKERFINEMLAKAVRIRMVIPYTDEDVAKYNHISRCNLKRDNNIRLDRWRYEELNNLTGDVLCSAGKNSTPLDCGREQIIDEQEFQQGNYTQIPPELRVEPQLTAEPKFGEFLINMNSDSLTLYTQTQTESQKLTDGTYSQDYEMFNSQIPATSTQSLPLPNALVSPPLSMENDDTQGNFL